MTHCIFGSANDFSRDVEGNPIPKRLLSLKYRPRGHTLDDLGEIGSGRGI